MKIFLIIFLLVTGLSGCGKNGNLSHEGEDQRPKFDGFYDEE